MMHLDDFGIEPGLGIKDTGGLLRQVKEQVDPSREITRPNQGNPGGFALDGFPVVRIVPGGTDDDGLAMLASKSGKGPGGVPEGKIDHQVAIRNHSGRIVPKVNRVSDLATMLSCN